MRTIRISEELYTHLTMLKHGNDTFGITVLRLYRLALDSPPDLRLKHFPYGHFPGRAVATEPQ